MHTGWSGQSEMRRWLETKKSKKIVDEHSIRQSRMLMWIVSGDKPSQ